MVKRLKNKLLKTKLGKGITVLSLLGMLGAGLSGCAPLALTGAVVAGSTLADYEGRMLVKQEMGIKTFDIILAGCMTKSTAELDEKILKKYPEIKKHDYIAQCAAIYSLIFPKKEKNKTSIKAKFIAYDWDKKTQTWKKEVEMTQTFVKGIKQQIFLPSLLLDEKDFDNGDSKQIKLAIVPIDKEFQQFKKEWIVTLVKHQMVEIMK